MADRRWSNPPYSGRPVPGWAHPPRPVAGDFGDHVMTAFSWVDDSPPRIRSMLRVVCATCGVDSGSLGCTKPDEGYAHHIALELVSRWGSSCDGAAATLKAAEVMET